jgi:hypothetical protein
MENITYKCEFCNYHTKRKYNLSRHHNAMHYNENSDGKNTVIDGKNTVIDGKNTVIDGKNTVIDVKNTVTDKKCEKCNKILSSKRYL